MRLYISCSSSQHYPKGTWILCGWPLWSQGFTGIYRYMTLYQWEFTWVPYRRTAFEGKGRCAKLESYLQLLLALQGQEGSIALTTNPSLVRQMLPQSLKEYWDSFYDIRNGLSRSINQNVADKDRLSRFYYLVEWHLSHRLSALRVITECIFATCAGDSFREEGTNNFTACFTRKFRVILENA